MITFKKKSDSIILKYKAESTRWVYDKINERGDATLRKSFTVGEEELITKIEEYDEPSSIEFKVASLDGDYFRFPANILSLTSDLFIQKDIEITTNLFIAEREIAIFPKIDNMINGSIYIGGDIEGNIPEVEFSKLLKNFPNSYELTRYATARISSVISSYIETNKPYEENYQKYLNKKISKIGLNLRHTFAEYEEQKYVALLRKLRNMLDDEEQYSERQWQREISQMILLIYPKYIRVFEEVPVRDTYNQANRSIDFMLVDSSGNTDIIEIKKPFDKCLVTHGTYRDNFIPLREFSGTVMQIEKYIFYLNKWGIKGEEKLSKLYRSFLPNNLKIKITNPSGIIIMGRSTDLTNEQYQDFEVIKRKYKNIIDVISYDDLISRLEVMIAHWKKSENE
jgi:hypothetical protein